MNHRQILRQQIRYQRQQLTLTEQKSAANKVAEQLQQLSIFQHSQHLATYSAVGGEIDPAPLLQLAWQQNKICYLPVLAHDQSLRFVRYNSDDNLKPNRFNIHEPEIKPEKIISAQNLDLVLLPLVAFDVHGNRLGMGKGYYDRTFEFLLKEKKIKPYLIGLAYEFQKVESISKETWDVPLNAVITENNFYQFG